MIDYMTAPEMEYAEFKKRLDAELNKAADGFVKIGYLLKKARDTEVLKESGYKSVAEFAKKEYGLSADIVSRYIAINDRFSENGYSESLEARYQGFGLAKLQEMLTLPANIAEELEPEVSRSEIQTIKKEYAAEQEISDIEIAMEAAETKEDNTTLYEILKGYFHENPEEYKSITKYMNQAKTISDKLAPSGYRTFIYRVPGKGKMMMVLKGVESNIEIANMRNPLEKESYTWNDMEIVISEICSESAEEVNEKWQQLYNESFPEKKEAAPEPVKKKKESKVTVIPKPQKKEKIAPVQEKIEPVKEEPKEEIKEEPEIMVGEVIENVVEEVHEEIAEETAEETTETDDMFLKALLSRADKLIQNIKAKAWKQALMDLEILEEDIHRGEELYKEDDE